MLMKMMATLHVLGAQITAHVEEQEELLAQARDDRGSITIEQVLWAVGVIALVGIVLGAIKTFVSSKAEGIG